MKQDQHTAQGDAQLANDTAGSRYEVRIGGEVAGFADYRVEGTSVRFTHTEVRPAYEGQGIGKRLVAYALDDVRRSGRKVLPQCRFVAQYIARNEKEYGDLVVKG
ncbi:MAG: N-acetyltransferase [Variovorax sp.]|nr:MAG: N-acetyltransferase [Variovorax sp.]